MCSEATKTHLVGHFYNCWCPFVKLIHPVGKSSVSERQQRSLIQHWKCKILLSKWLYDWNLNSHGSLRQGYNDEVGSIEPFVLHEVRDEGDSLDGFTQTHLVRQDPVQVVVVEGNQPLQTFNLYDKTEFQEQVEICQTWKSTSCSW